MQLYKFDFIFTLTFLHLSFTAVVLQATASLSGWFTLKSLPVIQNVAVAVAGVGSISFMNASLNYNSVGLYQVSKLATVPCILLIKYFVSSETVNRKVQFSLLIVLAGVYMATVTDVALTQLGLILALIAVVSTAQFQIWQGSKQKQFAVDSIQLTASVTPYQAALSLALACIFEFPGDRSIWLHTLTPPEIVLIILSCLCAVAVNLVTFALIGKTSAVTYQVVGHFKTVLVLLGGYLFFYPTDPSKQGEMYKNIIGVVVAMVGVVLYGHVSHMQSIKEPDILDKCMPGN